MRTFLKAMALLVLLVLAIAGGWLAATIGIGARADPADMPDLERRFDERMDNVALIGRFTVSGREDRPAVPDRYDISSVEKVGDDRWRFNAKIGEVGVSLGDPPLVRWVDDRLERVGVCHVDERQPRVRRAE